MDRADAVKKPSAQDNTRTFKADKRYLLFPCSRGLSGQNRVFIDADDGALRPGRHGVDPGRHQQRDRAGHGAVQSDGQRVLHGPL